MEFELMIPFGVVIIIFATIICRKYIFMCAQHGQQLDGESPLWAW